MQDKLAAADKIRPFLKAMERSINEARSARTQQTARPTSQPVARPTNNFARTEVQEQEPQTLKARPKRSYLNP